MRKLHSQGHGLLHQKLWWRIILDEAHIIKNKNTIQSRAVSNLDSHLRWCLTGTPIQNHIDEVFPLIRFLEIKPYDDWASFNEKISKPYKDDRNVPRIIERLKAILKCKWGGKYILYQYLNQFFKKPCVFVALKNTYSMVRK